MELDRDFFEDLKQKYIILKSKYADSFEALYAVVLSNAYRSEYAKGGETLHRGFYSPSSADLVIGGCKRGRLLKRVTKTSTFDYEYIFNINGQLLCIKKFSKELKCLYSIEILFYEDVSFQSSHDTCHRIQLEKLVYKNNQMCEFDLYEYYPAQYLKFWEGNWTEPILRYDRYIFNRDDEGFLSKYIRIPMSEEKMNLETEICSHGYKVLAKRK